MEKLKKYIKLKGLSNAQAAAEIGCSRQYLHMLMNGRKMGIRIALKIERWSDGFVSAAELLGL